MNRKIEFYISGIVTGASGFFHVIGRNCEDTLRVGDVLEVAYRYVDPEGHGEVADKKEIALRVARLSAYEHDVEELGSGLTGTVSLVGTGCDHISPGYLLGGVVVESEVQDRHSVAGQSTIARD